MIRHTLLLAVALACTAAGASRLPAQEAAPLPADLLTHDQLAATGRANLADAVRALRPAWLRLIPARGRYAAVYVDSARAGSVEALAALHVDDVRWVQWSGPEVVERRWGAVDSAGRTPVLHVSTRLPLAAAHPAAPARRFETRPVVSLFAASTSPAGGDVVPDAELRPGLGAGVEVPAAGNTAVAASLARVTGDADGGGVAVWTGELALKARIASDETLSSFVSAGGMFMALRWDAAERGGTRRDAFTENGFGLMAGGGVELRLAPVIAFARADLSVPMIGGRRDGKLFTLRVGGGLPLGPRR